MSTSERRGDLVWGLLMAGSGHLERLVYRSTVDGTEDWALVRPADSAARVWAVVLHGHGSTGDQVFTRPDIQGWQQRLSELGMGILSPNLRGNAWMGPAATADLHALLARVRQDYGAEQFVFCSGSMGGTGNLVYAVCHPGDVAAVVALCPATDIASYYRWAVARVSAPILQEIAAAIGFAYGGDPDRAPEAYAMHSAQEHCGRLTMPVAIVHGDKDPTIPVEQSRHLVGSLRACGADVWYSEIAGGGHDAPLAEFETALDVVLRRL